MPFQQLTVEFQVLGELDGTTPAPRISRDPNDPDYIAPDERGIIVVPIDGNLGLIDPDLSGGRSSRGPRCIPWVYIDSPGGGSPFSQFTILDGIPDDGLLTPFPQRNGQFTGGLPLFYSEVSTTVPMGSAFGIIGYPATMDPKIVRLNIVGSSDIEEQALIDQACCCLQSPCTGENGPLVQGADNLALTAGPGQTVNFSGVNLGTLLGIEGEFPDQMLVIEPLRWALVEVNEDGTGQVFYAQSVVQSDLSSAEVTWDLTGASDGTYTIIAFDPDDPQCNSVQSASVQGSPILSAFIGDVPVDCPTVAALGPTLLVSTGVVGAVLTVTGTNLDGITLSDVALVPNGFPAAPLNITDVQINLDGNLEVTFDSGFSTGLFNLEVSVDGCPTAVLTNAVQVVIA